MVKKKRRSKSYKEGRESCKKNLRPNCPYLSENGKSKDRTDWFTGYYDEYFYSKYGEPWEKE